MKEYEWKYEFLSIYDQGITMHITIENGLFCDGQVVKHFMIYILILKDLLQVWALQHIIHNWKMRLKYK